MRASARFAGGIADAALFLAGGLATRITGTMRDVDGDSLAAVSGYRDPNGF
ncbi:MULTISPECIES: hypothetical protein [Burkholderia]|uniref:Uncharacterized protein n=1 Tax=Burkholderia cenocepacia TaxID=95486 RepID=A0ABD4US36_9BURK|nr:MULTISPECIES: hypothetical protein [Burkholderia]ARF88382.1 uncharacterized protein BCN122_II1639 [Burkholderia cenocepacia]MBG0875061.1 hypothetical protein [Burkholderia sp. 9777_1386]MBN3533936.1 hypothetical protein [Burkholderia cenocepacia]MBR7905649.1 hypothetical protein [Burkholderia cenocepacia]MBR8022633.1 hypothetical protein [Burkholderia cenocepacia]